MDSNIVLSHWIKAAIDRGETVTDENGWKIKKHGDIGIRVMKPGERWGKLIHFDNEESKS